MAIAFRSLDERLTAPSGVFYLPAVDALVRLVLDQSRRDRVAGRSVGVFVSGYPGSPLAGLDLALGRRASLLAENGVVHVPGANEELAITAITGTQMLDGHPHDRFEGVTSFWYGKGPGIDRSGDALKHGNFAGTSRSGAVVLLSGEDHEAKSSTMPFQEEYAFQAAGIPVLYPGSVKEILELGVHAVALSRLSGCWVALKLVSSLCDSGETVDLATAVSPTLPQVNTGGRRFEKHSDFSFFPGRNIEIERHLYDERHAAVAAYSRANRLDRVDVRSERDRLCIVAAGKSFVDVRQALCRLGVDDEALRHAGIRLVKIGLVYPLDRDAVREMVGDVDRLIVVEEKRGFLEDQLRAAVCDCARPIEVLGKLDSSRRPLFPVHGGMDADIVSEHLGPLLLELLEAPAISRATGRLTALSAIRARQYDSDKVRTPNYCSGCPHSTSTRLAQGQIAWGSPGCHSFASVIEQPERHIEAMTQFGGEGVPWIGLSPFTERLHMVQNVGDGSVFHSSYLNIRFCVATGVNITFKILYNGVIANTGAQEAIGAKSVPVLARLLALEGVSRVAIVTKDVRAYRGTRLPAVVAVYPVQDMESVSAELATIKGVTVLLYDESCANQRRRLQKRALLPPPNKFVLINERVCEGCGDCGRVSNCMSLEEVSTGLGPKIRIQPSTCNQDFSCLAGNCPAFATVTTVPGTGYRRPPVPELEAIDLPDPAGSISRERPFHIVSPGVGGTGVITVNAVLATAAAADGWEVTTYDQTGAAQKWGPVLSSLVLTPPSGSPAERDVAAGVADLYLALDLLSAGAPGNLDLCDPQHTVAVVNTTLFPTGEMVRDVTVRPSSARLAASLLRWTVASQAIEVPARELAEGLFGNFQMANLIVVGAAYQAGLLPVDAGSIEAAVRMNGVAADENVRAFRCGRWWVQDRDAVVALLRRRLPEDPFAQGDILARPAGRRLRRRHRQRAELERRSLPLGDEARALVLVRLFDLLEYQSLKWAGKYLDFVLAVAEKEAACGPEASGMTEAVARSLFKLMTYKDEYEVARLYRHQAWKHQVTSTFAAPTAVTLHFDPPVLRRWFHRKIALGGWSAPLLWMLTVMRHTRGTAFDIFGASAHRREERTLITWYRALVLEALQQVSQAAGSEDGSSLGVDQTAGSSSTREVGLSQTILLELARLPDLIRGYDKLKETSAASARQRGAELLEQLTKSMGRV